jgi:hypothetical protein
MGNPSDLMEQTMLFQTTFLIAYALFTGKMRCIGRVRSGDGRDARDL